MSITPTAPAGTATQEVAAPAAPPTPSFIVDTSFLENLDAPTGDPPLPEPSRTEPEPGGSAPAPTPPEPLPLDEDDFSTGAALAAPPLPAPPAGVTPPPDGSPLKETDPPWMHQALQELESDPDLDLSAKAAIKKIDPAGWRIVSDWKKSYDFRQTMQREDYDVPGHLDKHLPKLFRADKVPAVKAHILLQTIDDPDALATFARDNPQKYADLMTALVQVSPQVVEQVVNRSGFTMAKLQELPPFDREAALGELQKDPNWNLIEANPNSAKLIGGLLDGMENAHKELSLTRSRVQDLEGKIPAPTEQEATPSVAPQILSDALTAQWVPNAQGALTQSGLAMPTEEEFKAYPFAANLMKTAITTAIHGMPGVMPGIFEELQNVDFDEDLNYGADSKAFTEAMRAGDLAAGKRSALNLGRFFYEKASARAKTGFIQNMYNRGKREMALAKADPVKYKEFITLMRGLPETTPPPQPPLPTNGGAAEVLNAPPTTPENKAIGSGFLADQIFLDSLK